MHSGGIDYGMPDTRANPNMKLPSLPRLEYSASELVKYIPANMVERDWLPMGLDACTATAIKRIYHEQNVSVVSDPCTRIRDELKYTAENKVWLKSMLKRKGLRGKCRRMNAPSIEHDEFISKMRSESRDCSYDATFEVFIPKGGLDVKPPILSLEVIERAIRQSAFRDLTTARIVLDCDVYRLYREVVNKATNAATRLAANKTMDRLTSLLGPAVATKVLEGFRGDGNAIACLVSPNLASYIANLSIECMLYAPSEIVRMNESDWVMKLADISWCCVAYISRYTNWLQLSQV